MPFALDRKRVLVAGGTGFIGTNLIQGLLKFDVRIRATCKRTKPRIFDDRVEYVSCDLRRMEDCTRLTKDIDVVYMCAAVTSGAASIVSAPLQHVTPNIIMNTQMLEASYRAGVGKFVYVSSTVVYPPSGDRPVREDEAFLGDPYESYFASGWMKRYTESLCRLYAERLDPRMPTVVLRPTSPYGPFDKFDPETSHVAAALVRKVAERQNPLQVWGTGDEVRDFIYIDDLIEALILATEKVETFDAINVGCGKGQSVRDVVRILLKLRGIDGVKVVFDPDKPTTIPKRLVDVSKAHRVLGFRTKVSLDEGLGRTLDWYLENATRSRTTDN